MTDAELIHRLAEVSGQLFDQPELIAEWSRDWWPYGARIPLREDDLPIVAAVPDSTEDVAATVRIAAEAGRPIVIKGGGSNLTGALRPHPGAILLDVHGLNVIDPVNERDHTVRVDAGVFGGELEERLNEQGFSLCHQPRSLLISTIGGWVATRATGLLATKYGGIEDQIEAIEVVLADGTVAHSDFAPRLLDLFVGSLGSIGVIASVTLRVRPVPEECRLHAFGIPSYDGALDALRGMVQRGITPAVACLYDSCEGRYLHGVPDRVNDHLLFVGFDGEAELVVLEERMAQEALLAAGALHLGAKPAWTWWDQRHSADWLIDGNAEEGHIADAVAIIARWSDLPVMIASVRAALESLVDEVWHHSDQFTATGATVTFPFFIRERNDERAMEVYREAWAAAMWAAHHTGGIDAHRQRTGQDRFSGLWNERRDGTTPSAAVKRALDPEGRFNPGPPSP